MSVLGILCNQDAEMSRQYFLLVRLIHNALVGGRISKMFDLGGIDMLDYRIPADLLYNAGNSVVTNSEVWMRARGLETIATTTKTLVERERIDHRGDLCA